MALVAPTFESTQETSNHGRLSCLLIDVGCMALRNAFDRIYPVERLHTLLANCSVQETLQLLRKEKILTPTQWCKLYPAIHSSVSSSNFDLVLLGILLRNFCGLNPPDTGWNSLPTLTDTSLQANIARINYYRNVVYDHASQQSLDYETFMTYWQDIRDILVRLAGTRYAAAIDGLKERSLDPEFETHYHELLKRWKKDEDSIKDRFDAMDSQAEVSKMLLDIKTSIVNSEDVIDETENQSPIDKTELQVSKETQEGRSQFHTFSASVNLEQLDPHRHDPAILRGNANPLPAQSRVLSHDNPDHFRQLNTAARTDVRLQGTNDPAILHGHKTRARHTTGYDVGASESPAILRSHAYPSRAQSRVLFSVNPDPYRQYNMAAQPDVMLQGTDDAAILRSRAYPQTAQSRVLSGVNPDPYRQYNMAAQPDVMLQGTDDAAILRSRAYPQTAQSRVLSGVNPDPYRQYNMAAQPDVMLQGTDDAAILHNHPYPPMAHSRVLSRDNSDYYSPYNTASQTDAGLQARQVPGNRREVHTDIPSRTGAHMDSTPSADSKFGRLRHPRTAESPRTVTKGTVTERKDSARQTASSESMEVELGHSTGRMSEGGNSSKDASVAGSSQARGCISTTRSTFCDFCSRQGSSICRNCVPRH